MDYISVIRLILLTKALKYHNLCEISKLCSETEKAKLYGEFSNELTALADLIHAGEEDETETGDS